MRSGIHPKYEWTTIGCACGTVIHIRSTKPGLKVEVCSKCHPLFTGKERIVDTASRIERFHKKYSKKEPKAAS